MKRFALVLLFTPVLSLSAATDWQQTISDPTPGDFPNPPALESKYRFGWMGLNGGAAEATITKPSRDVLQLQVTGGSTGVVRKLWKLDATYDATMQASTLRPIKVRLVEDYGWDKIVTSLTFTPKGVNFQRLHLSPGATEKQKVTFPNLFDLETALYYVRSQKLEPGENYRLVVFPGNTAYLATVRVIGKEKIQVKAGKYNALKFEVRLQKITPQLELVPHNKVKRAYAWLSDDANRLLLRVDAEIFAGSVWMELQSVKLTDS